MKIRGIHIAYDDTGTGPAIVFIHGQPFNRTMWRYQVPVFASDYRLIIPDLRGYGDSDIPAGTTLLDELALDIIHLLEHLQVTKAVFVGLSMGGQIVLELYRLAPQLFSGLVLADTTADAESPEGYTTRLELADRIEQQGMAVFVKERMHKFLSPQTFSDLPEVVAHLEQMMLATSAAGSARVQRGRAERRDHNHILSSIKVPVMIVVGAGDEFTPVAMAESMQRQIPHASLAIIGKASHIPNMEQPVTFNRHLQEFLQQIPGA